MPRFNVQQPFPIGRSLVQVGQVKLPKRFEVTVTEHEDGSPDVRLLFEVRDGVPQCREVNIVATEGGTEVRCSGLAGVRVQDVLELAIKNLVGVHVDGAQLPRVTVPANRVTSGDREALRQVRESRKALRATVTDAMLRQVAEIYRDNLDGHPTQAVADHYGVSHRTAVRYVARAREADHLGPAVKGKAGEL